GAVAVVPQQGRADGVPQPGAAGDENVHVAVVVVIALDAGQAAQLLRQARRLGALLEGAVPLVVVVGHRDGRVPAGNDDIEQAVVVEVLQNGPSRLVEAGGD